jgi:hypothetical protein
MPSSKITGRVSVRRLTRLSDLLFQQKKELKHIHFMTFRGTFEAYFEYIFSKMTNPTVSTYGKSTPPNGG